MADRASSPVQIAGGDQLSKLPPLAQGRRADPRGLAKALVQRGWLTLFQAKQLLEGNGKTLLIGPYFILDRLGKGGLSQVFKARHAKNEWRSLPTAKADASSFWKWRLD